MAERDIPIIGFLIKKIVGSRNERFVKRYTTLSLAINKREPEMRQMTDAQLRGRLGEFRDRVAKTGLTDDILVDALATARESMDRAVGIRNVFNPKYAFDPSVLPAEVQGLYRQIREQAEAMPPVPALGEWLGGPQDGKPESMIPGWRRVEIPPHFYDAVRQVFPESKPPFRARPFEVQLVGAMVLGQGKIAEMKTGEGKTIVGPLAAYVAACGRWQVHVITVNDYLVQRDRDWTAPFFHAVGLTVGAIHPQHMQDEGTKRQMYRCDVVYGTTSEFGFDYLRDNMKKDHAQQVQRKRDFAIVDEVDSTLIDEARTPLIISGDAHDDEPRYDLADRLARHLVQKQKPWQDAEDAVTDCLLRIKSIEGDLRQLRDGGRKPELAKGLAEAKAALPGLQAARNKYIQYYETKPERKQAFLTHDGITEAQRVAGVGSFYVNQNMDLPHLLEQAVRAHTVYELDKDYIVREIENPRTGMPQMSVVIVDPNTGRAMVGRQWSDGLHQAIECKEAVPINKETQTVATITIQNYFKMYKKLAGMTGTADTEAQEFHDIYKLDVVAIPTNRPSRRKDYEHVIYLSAKDKISAIVEEIKAFHDVGRPMLIGTTNVEKSERLSELLTSKHAIKHETLNAKPDKAAREAEIVEGAGQLGSVMISTNMAGRGTDIKLGAYTREQLLEHWLRRGIAPRTLTVDADEATLREQVYRKIASTELGIAKREAEAMTFPDIELALLRHWAVKTTILSEAQIGKLSADRLRQELDRTGRCLLHRITWFKDIEDMGGLHVIGTERHESRRIDNQLRGRAGRQGDQGSTRFFVSLEDDITKLFAGETMQNFLAKFGGMKEGVSIEHPWISGSIERVQRKVEEHHFQQRKNLLEYDEVREHHRQRFYGTRQRVLEGRDVKGLIMDWIEETIRSNASRFLSKDYSAECAAEHATNVLGIQIQADRLRGRDLHEMIDTIRADAKDDERAEIDRSLGEYMPQEGSDINVDLDIPGLVFWAKSRFNVDLDAPFLEQRGTAERRNILNMLTESASRKIDAADLSGIGAYLEKSYGVEQLAKWSREKFLLEVTTDELKDVLKAEGDPADLLITRAREFYTKKEIDYPIKFAIEMTKVNMAYSPQEAFEGLCRWANTRYQLNWTVDQMKTRTPQSMRQELQAKADEFVRSGKLEDEVAKAVGCVTDEDLDAHVKARFGGGIPESLRYLDKDDRPAAIRAFIENILRAEMLRFERTIMLDVMDDMWKSHLYAMDQLREGIGFRAFSQNDPRIEFKREGAHMFTAALQTIKDRVTDHVFKVELTPQAPRPAPNMGGGMGGGFGMRPPAVRPAGAPAGLPAGPSAAASQAGPRSAFGASSVIGPGFASGFGPPLRSGPTPTASTETAGEPSVDAGAAPTEEASPASEADGEGPRSV